MKQLWEVALHLKASLRFFGPFFVFLIFLSFFVGRWREGCRIVVSFLVILLSFVIQIFSCPGSSIPDLGQSVTE